MMLAVPTILTTLPCLVACCATPLLRHRTQGIMRSTTIHDKRQAELITVPSQNKTHWTVAENLREMQVTDDAFVAKDLANFNHAESIIVYQGGGVTRNITQHFTDMQLVYSMIPDIQLSNHNYPIRFGEGDWTVVLSKVTGRNEGPLPEGNTYLPPTMKAVDYGLMTIGRWEYGLLQEEYLSSDDILQYRQIGLLPDAPRDNLPEIYFDPMGNTGLDNAAANKQNANISDTAFNTGSTDAGQLLYSQNLSVYGLSDDPMDLEQYMAYLGRARTAFPNLRYIHQQVIAEGEWTATLGILSGTQRGAWVLPAYISAQPILATNETFSLLHYVIAHWENGEIVDMRVNLDMVGILDSIGIQL